VIARFRRVLRFAVLALISGCIIPFAIPPLRAEVGTASRSDGPIAAHVAVGTHAASATLTGAQRFDVGLGYLVEPSTAGTTHGAYADGALFVERLARTRTSLGVRNELRWNAMGPGYATKLRIDTELFSAGTSTFESDDRCGTATGTRYGTAAIGLYAEAGRAWMPDTRAAWVATAGITARLPSSVGVWIGIPWICR
jgi:hypothetical protein